MPADIANNESGLSARTKINDGFGNSAFVPFPNGITLSGGSDVLDTYEEGTWTPDVQDASANSASITITSADYTRTGRECTVTGDIRNIDTTGLTAGDEVQIHGLPFTSSSVGVAAIMTDRVAISGEYLIVEVQSTTFARIRMITTAAGDTSIIVSNLTSTEADFEFTLTYFV